MDPKQKMAKEDKAGCSHKRHYNKNKGNAGVHGTNYQINLLTIFLLNGLKISEEWKLSTENEDAGKFDDLVFESPEGDIFLQAKHKEKKNEISYKELLSTNSKKDDFSLGKYFFSYLEIRDNFNNVKNVIICTNDNLRKNANSIQHIKEQNLLEEDLLYFEGGNSTIYTFNESIIPVLKEHINAYFDKNLQGKNIPRDVISDDNIEKFLSCLQLRPNYPNEGSLNAAVEKIISETELSKNLDSKTVYNFFYRKMQDWFKQGKGVYLTKAHAKAFFCEIRSNQYCNTLESLDVHFDNNDLPVSDSNKKVWHIVPQEHYMLNLLKLYGTLQKNKKEFLLMAPDYNDDIKKSIIDAFQVDPYFYLIIVCRGDSSDFFTEEICVKVKELLEGSEYKKLILVSAEDHELAEYFKGSSIYEMVEEAVEFRHLNDKSKKTILSKNIVLFQREETCLSRLLSGYKEEDLSEFIDSETLVKLVSNEKIKVGAKVEALSEDIKDCYVNRTFITESRKISEQEMWDLTTVTGKMVLISDSPGLGKTTTLTYLAGKIKEHSPNVWVVKLDINDYTSALSKFLDAGRQHMTIPDLLNSQQSTKLKTDFEKKLFNLPERVLLMIDGVDEISPNYEDIVVNLIQHCMENPSFVKIYVSTRPHLRQKLEEKFKVEAMTLSPFSKQNQEDFLTRYWKMQLGLKKSLQTKKCKVYAEQLFIEMWYWTNEWHVETLAAVPLHTLMMAEVFQDKEKINVDLGDWQSCREFLISQELHPRLPQKINLAKLYQLFLAKKKHIFIEDKSKSKGNVIVTGSLDDAYNECRRHHQLLALEHILREKAELMNYYRDLGERNPEGKNAVKLGIVQQIDGRYAFIHRTFAEFYVAECFVAELQYKDQNRLFQDFFVDVFLVLPQYTVIRSFLDNFLGEETIPEETSNAYSSLNYTKRLYNGENTFLHILISEGCFYLVRFFLNCLSQTETLTDINRIRDASGKTLLHFACEDYFNMVEMLVNEEDFSGRNERIPLKTVEHNLKMIELLLTKGSDPNVENEYGDTVLHEAAQTWDPNIIKVLVNNRADVHHKNEDGCTPLHVACKCSNLEVVKELVENDSRLDDQNKEGSTALHVTARQGHVDTLEYLIKKGADAAIVDQNGRVALHYAVYSRCCDVIDFLSCRCDINVGDERGNTALHLAAELGYLKVVKVLVKKNANVIARNKMDRTPSGKALSRGHLDVMEYLIREAVGINMTDDHGRSVDYSHDISLDATRKYLADNNVAINVRDDGGMTALHYAVRHDHRERRIHYVKVLIEAGADVNIADNRGRTALQHAIKGSNLGVVQYLFDNGADLNITDCKDRTLLHVATKRGDAIFSRILLNTNVDVNARDSEGRTAFHYVCSEPNAADLVEDFVRMRADVNAKDNRNRTPLHDAVESGAPIVALLIRLDAEVDVIDDDGVSPLLSATIKGSADDVRLLLEKGANPNARDFSGNTALTNAVNSYNIDLLHALVQGGADVDITNKEGCTALHLCIRWNRLNQFQYLVDSGANVNAPDDDGSTPLHEVHTLEAAELLAVSGANVNAENRAGETPLHVVAQRDYLYQSEYDRLVDTMRFLLEKGASVDSRDARGRTALHVATEEGRVAMVRLLLKSEVDVSMVDEEGRTALDLAIGKEHVGIISLLEERNEEATPRHENRTWLDST